MVPEYYHPSAMVIATFPLSKNRDWAGRSCSCSCSFLLRLEARLGFLAEEEYL